jgi:hypothetical protein
MPNSSCPDRRSASGASGLMIESATSGAGQHAWPSTSARDTGQEAASQQDAFLPSCHLQTPLPTHPTRGGPSPWARGMLRAGGESAHLLRRGCWSRKSATSSAASPGERRSISCLEPPSWTVSGCCRTCCSALNNCPQEDFFAKHGVGQRGLGLHSRGVIEGGPTSKNALPCLAIGEVLWSVWCKKTRATSLRRPGNGEGLPVIQNALPPSMVAKVTMWPPPFLTSLWAPLSGQVHGWPRELKRGREGVLGW